MSGLVAPPRRAERLLERCLGPDPRRRAVLGDLREEHAARVRRCGPLRAHMWYVGQALSIGARYAGRPASGGWDDRDRRLWARVSRSAALVRESAGSALRAIRRRPAFSVSIVATFALGLGANATMFGVIDRLLLSPPQHVADADGLRLLRLEGLGPRSTNSPRAWSYPDFESIEDSDVLASAAAYRTPVNRTMGSGAQATRVLVQAATASLFPTLGVRPLRGRFYGPAEDREGAPPTAVIGETFWEQSFGRDEGVLGRAIRLGVGTYEIIGIAPSGFTGPELSRVDVWLPLETNTALESRWALESRGAWWFRVVVRSRDGVRDEVVEARLTDAHLAGISAYLEGGGREMSNSMGGRIRVSSIIAGRGANASNTSSISIWLGGVSLFVLLIACATVANLLLARGLRRRHEVAIRVAMGVGRRRLVAQHLVEAGVLAGLGAVAAIIVARWSSAAVHSALLPGVAFTDDGLSIRLVVFLSVAAGLVALMSGVLPALQAAASAPGEVLKGSLRGSTSGSSRVRNWLMTAQVALSVVLLVGAGLFVRSLRLAARADIGFDPGQVAEVTIEGESGVPDERLGQIHLEAVDRIRALPGVDDAVLLGSPTPLFGYNTQSSGMRPSGTDSFPSQPDGGPFWYSGGPGFIETLGFRVVSGRSLRPEDYQAAGSVLLVSETFARVAWPGLDPTTQCLTLRDGTFTEEGPEPCRPVVGVYADLAVSGLEDGPTASVAWPEPMDDATAGGRPIVVRSAALTVALQAAIRDAVSDLSTEVRYVRVRPITERVEDMIAPWRLGATMFTAFGGLALLLAVVGLYSILAFEVAERRREIGIRSALGARRADVVSLVVTRACRFVAAGLAIGGAVALVAGRSLQNLLYDVRATDPAVYVAVILTLLAAGLLAAALPAWRAGSVDPTVAMDAE